MCAHGVETRERGGGDSLGSSILMVLLVVVIIDRVREWWVAEKVVLHGGVCADATVRGTTERSTTTYVVGKGVDIEDGMLLVMGMGLSRCKVDTIRTSVMMMMILAGAVVLILARAHDGGESVYKFGAGAISKTLEGIGKAGVPVVISAVWIERGAG